MLLRVLLIPAILTVIQAKTASFALIDNARLELEQLIDYVIGAVSRGHIRLDSYYDSFVTYSDEIQTEGQIIINFEEQRIHGQINAIRDLALSAGIDIANCLEYEERLLNIKENLLRQMDQCISLEIEEAKKIIAEYKYLIDIHINRPYNLEYQLNLCDVDNEDCISPIYEQIQFERRFAAESIETNQIVVNTLINWLKPIIQDCSNLVVSDYVLQVDAILAEISECADALIS